MELSYIDGILALAGVVVGFVLSTANESIKEKRKKNSIKKALYNELTNIFSILQNAKNIDESRVTIPNEKFPFILETYNATKAEIASFLNPQDLWLVQRTYAQVEKLNESIGSCPDGFSKTRDNSGMLIRIYAKEAIALTNEYVTKARQVLT